MVAEIRAGLLDPEYWRPGLQQYSAATHIAVQLFDFDGTAITECINPQPLWTALQEKRSGGDTCGFSIGNKECRCIREAFQQRTAIFVREVSGIVHFAVPLFLQDKAVGVLLAGQVFDEYPEMLSVERAARGLGPIISATKIWDLARRTLPLGMPTLRIYSDLLTTLANAALQARHQSMLETQRLEQLRTAMENARSALLEKEALLREVHHRVKNNLQVISSLLSLKAMHAGDEAVVKTFGEMRQRIHSIAAIHESLYRSNAFAGIDMVAKARELAEALVRFYDAQDDMNIEFAGHKTVMLPIEAAVPAGLILHELLSNSLKHGFPSKEKGNIRVIIGERESHCTINVSDNGAGLPREFVIGKSQSFGLMLVDLLVSQLGGTLNIGSDSGGTSVDIRFPLAGAE